MRSLRSNERPPQRPGTTDGAYVRSLRTEDDLPIRASKKIRRRRGEAQPAQKREASAAPGDHRWRVCAQLAHKRRSEYSNTEI